MARQAGVTESVIAAVRAGEFAVLPPEVGQAAAFAYATATGDSVAAKERGTHVEQLWGRRGRSELALAIAVARTYPTIKRALGYAADCSRTAGLP